MFMSGRFFVFLVFLGFIFISVPVFSLPDTMVFNGVLTDSNNNLLDGQYNLTFRIYTSSTGGSPVWSETQSSVDISNGVFYVELGNVSSLSSLDFNNNYWLSVEVNSQGELSPRLKMNTQPYARIAENVKTGANININQLIAERIKILTSGYSHYLYNQTDDVGSFLIYQGEIAGINKNGTSLGTYNAMPLVFFTNSTTRIFVSEDGNVGIGTTSPGLGTNVYGGKILTIYNSASRGIVELARNTNTDGDSVGILSFVNDANSDISAATRKPVAWIEAVVETSNSNTNKDSGGNLIFRTKAESGIAGYKRMIITSSGNVGIGTTTPTQKLTVLGTTNTTNLILDNSSLKGCSGKLYTDSNGNVLCGTDQTGSQALSDVLSQGNSAGSYNIDMNGNDLFNATNINGTNVYQNGNKVLDTSTSFSNTSGSDASVSGTYNSLDIQLGSNVVGDNEINYSQVTLNDFTNDANFLSSESDTLQNVTDRGSTTTNSITVGGLTTTGSVSAGSITSSGDLAVNTNQFYVNTTSGNVGIGTTTPAYKLDVAGVVSATNLLLSTGIIYPSADGTSAIQITKADGSTAVVTVDTTNSFMGIGTTPSSTLDVRSTLDNNMRLSYDATNYALFYVDSAGILVIRPTNDRILLETSNVSGQTQLSVQGSTSPQIYAKDTTTNLRVKLQATDTLGYIGTDSAHNLAIATGNVERIRVDTSGNVGIGTTSPTSTLDINSDRIRVRSTFTPTGTADTAGNVGDIAWDDNYVYVKTSVGWKRAALSTW